MKRSQVEHVLRAAAAISQELSFVVGSQAILLPFHRPDDHASTPGRPGGGVHAIRAGQTARSRNPTLPIEQVLWAKSDCDGCEVWLHANRFAPGFTALKHSHTEDEIIVVLNGEMKLGRIAHHRGAALAIDADTFYSFTVGEDGLEFVNFRPGASQTVVADGATRDGPPD